MKFGQKSKLWSKIVILAKNRKLFPTLITDAADVLTYNLTYKDAADCGWSWDTDEINQKITFGYTLYPTDNINKVTEQGRVVKLRIRTYPGKFRKLKKWKLLENL